MSGNIKIAPSILSADFSKLGQEIKVLDKSNCEYIHIDIMDGHFVPNLTIGPDVVKSLRKYTAKVFDVHLMIDPVKEFIPQFIEAGADIITIHHEISDEVIKSLELVKKNKKKVGISIKPLTPAKVIHKYLEIIDLVLIMTVEPGFGGQQLIKSQIEKIREIRKIVGDRDIDIEVDGGVNLKNAKELKNAGANILVSGSTIFKSENYQETIDILRNL
jgi:ribulose-phosphate 3-epimerase